jgi:hypothetical protein
MRNANQTVEQFCREMLLGFLGLNSTKLCHNHSSVSTGKQDSCVVLGAIRRSLILSFAKESLGYCVQEKKILGAKMAFLY